MKTRTLLLLVLSAGLSMPILAQREGDEERKPGNTNTNSNNGQEEWPAPGNYRVETLKNKMYPFNLFVSAGLMFDADLANFSKPAGGSLAYGRARYIIGQRFSVSGMGIFGVGNLYNSKNYSVFEGRATYFFKKGTEPRTETKKFGSEGGYEYSGSYTVGVGTYTGITGSVSMVNRTFTNPQDTLFRSWELHYLPTDSIWQDTKNVGAQVTMMQFSFGFAYSSSQHYKGRYKITFPSTIKKSGIIRKNNAIDLSMEMLYAPVISVGKTPLAVDTLTQENSLQQFELKNINLKHFGFRFQVEARSGIFGFRTEFGFRPGVKHLASQNVPNPKFGDKLGSRIYLQLGIGLSFGAL
ncbi:MAG: hypothetical protein IT233_07005 [Bacteroidia bacterium]|nr:hypothetical protein [Bacteroidia bacterium]